jgi:AraC-like DNA-binding protein
MRVRQEHVVHPSESFRFRRFETARFNVPFHRHRQLELTLIERGAGLRFVADHVAPFEAPDLVLIGSDVPHCWISTGGSGAEPAAATVVQFPRELLEQLALPELRRVRPLAARAQRGLRITGACRTAAIRELERMSDCDNIGRLARLIEILGLLCAHSADLEVIARSSLPAEHNSRHRNKADRVIAWIQRQIGDRLRGADAARVAGVASASFSRFFRREVGKGFSEYVNDIRCSEACLQLRQSAKPIGLIAQECGFANMSNFNRQFRRRFGAAPSAYREMM